MRSTIRHATAADAARIRTLQAELTEPAPTLLDAALTQVDTASNAGATTADNTSPAIGESFGLFVSVNNADLAVGYLLAVTGEPTHIAELVVEPAYRREGRAKALLATMLEQYGHPITVHVAVDNTAARSLYEAVGFQEQARSDDQFDDTTGVTLRYPSED
ncbi:N-acetyltransferase [Halonotius aquaticus]|uniref:N-acetyltransferase n=1 Tax=Halonotius aquaticus TaxID=2216978 RepID=A0A3A6PLM5_9EURY|nr:N-acetyltransferase [Halonotius aquaticus]RJX42359.1 N-acetyltransferase [Halonotius aquaticus]